MREVDARQDRDGHLPADRRPDPLPRPGDRRAARARAAKGGPRPPVRVPGPRRLARPALEDPPLAPRAAGDPHRRCPGRSARPRSTPSCAPSGCPTPTSTCIRTSSRSGQQRRVGARADPHAPAEAHHPGRADVGARRVGAGQRAEAVPPSPGDVLAHLSLHLPRPRGGARDVPARGGDVPRQGRRDRRGRPRSSRARAIRTRGRSWPPCRASAAAASPTSCR